VFSPIQFLRFGIAALILPEPHSASLAKRSEGMAVAAQVRRNIATLLS
jgi:hypothetical protein